MELKEGMYVRTKDGLIDKVIIDYKGCCNSTTCNCKHVSCEHNYYDEEDIVKTSDNPIDLIEVGDYVNGYKVSEIIIDKDISDNDKLKFGDDDLVLTFKSNHDTYYLYIEDIENVVTKEQFDSMKYVIKGDK